MTSGKSFSEKRLREEFEEIGKVIRKTGFIQKEAENHLNNGNYDLSVRRSQESFELFTKLIFRIIGRKYPRTHNISKQIYEIVSYFDYFDIEKSTIAQIVLLHQTLELWRNRSFYGDEKLGISEIFNEEEAKLALLYTKQMAKLCYRVLFQTFVKPLGDEKYRQQIRKIIDQLFLFVITI